MRAGTYTSDLPKTCACGTGHPHRSPAQVFSEKAAEAAEAIRLTGGLALQSGV